MEEALGGASSRRLSVGPPRAPGDGARVRGRRPPVFPACVHRNLDTDPPLRAEDATAEGARRPAAPNEEQPGTTRSGGRGQYDRSCGKGARKPWLLHVQQYVDAVVSGNFAQLGVACASTCLNAGKCIELVNIGMLKHCVVESFGLDALNQAWGGDVTKNHDAVQSWFQLGLHGRVVNDAGTVQQLAYKIGDRLVCHSAWGAMRGIPPSTAETIHRAIRSGETQWTDGGMRRAEVAAARSARGTLLAAATTWWSIRLDYYEIITHCGIILYPRDIQWKDVYAEEFVAEMRLLGYAWKEPPSAETEQQNDEQTADPNDHLSDEQGSIATWYAGRTTALRLKATEKLGQGRTLQLKSRKKHSAYKECDECQKARLDVREAISKNLGPDEINRRKETHRQHLMCIMAQRRKLEQITQMANHECLIVENSDKCGDDCLYLPNSSRPTSANMSKYKYRLSLQANVYAGKLFHLSLLMPNLTTGADFGISTFLASLVRMFQLGEITSLKRRLLRGIDGGSENVNFASLGMNSTLVHELHLGSILEVQQHRLPPDHSHHWTTDGTFSVIEGWLRADGFKGCATVWDLIELLRSEFAKADNYKDKKVEITFLLVSFAFTKWFDGCIHQEKLKHIGKPLVWRHIWSDARKEVVVQYKMLLSDEATFKKDEWGPWVEKMVEHNNEETGRVELVKVLRSDPAGVRLMKAYPNIGIDPGVTSWIDESAWKRDKVFSDLSRWAYPELDDAGKIKAKGAWASLGSWHASHPTSDSIVIGQPATICPGLSLPTSLPTWSEMWKVLKTNVIAPPIAPSPAVAAPAAPAAAVTAIAAPGAAAAAPAALPAPTAAAAAPTAAPAAAGNRRIDRHSLSSSSTAATVNVVFHPGYTHQDQQAARLNDYDLGRAYLRENVSESGALFFVSLQHREGELKVGLGRRTFNNALDDSDSHKYEIEWFERKNKRERSWGKQPGFRLTVGGYDRSRKPYPSRSLEAFADFLPVAVQLTPASAGSDQPALSQACLLALRRHLGAQDNAGEEEESAQEGEDEGSSLCSSPPDEGSSSDESPRRCKKPRKG